MNSRVGQLHVSTAGSSVPVTETPQGARNQRVGWMLGIYDDQSFTPAGQVPTEKEASWAQLAAAARGDWFAENPF